MGDSWRTWDRPGDDEHLDFTWGTDCHLMACKYREPHEHGFACDRTCQCRVDESRWRLEDGDPEPLEAT